ncbi:MAG: globin [Tepidiformaceae bacterium]
MPDDPDTPLTLFALAGGAAGVDAIVESFYALVAADAPLRAVYPADLGPGKEKLKLYFEQWLGGEARYSALYGHPRLRIRHFPFAIDDRAAGRWLRHMREAMQSNGVPVEAERVIFEQLGPLARHMVNASSEARVPRPE